MTIEAISRRGSAIGQLVPVYVVTMLLSASLLFLVEPMFARMALPLLGGTPAVWAIALCFFQAALLGGYVYAHLLNKHAGPQAAAAIHLVLMAGGWFFLPVHIEASAVPDSGAVAGLWLVAMMAKSIGYPFFFLSATAPLLQSWFARTIHPNADNPYFLYSASNIGSIGALILYPFLVEPNLGLAMQARLWSIGYGLLMVGIAVSGMFMLRHLCSPLTHWANTIQQSISMRRKLWWVLMAFVPSALLVAWTNHITTDIASAPFLWLPPLVLYLLSFVLVFRDKPLVSLPLARIAQLLTLPVCFAVQFSLPLFLTSLVIVSGAVFFFATTIICHRQLYETRPDAAQLTEFYMLMSVGGVLGGLFVSLLAPVTFSSVAEYPLLMVAALLCWSPLFSAEKLAAVSRLAAIPLITFCVVLLATPLAAGHFSLPDFLSIKNLSIASFAALTGYFAISRTYGAAAVCLLLALYTGAVPLPTERLLLRNYFGEIKIIDGGAEEPYRVLQHGTTMHGAERLSELAPDYTVAPHALTYYSPEGGMAKALLSTQQRLAAAGKTGTYRIVGLGTGSLACYAKPGEDWAYYEIDPHVTEVARDPTQFSFLSKCKPGMDVIEGDARLTMKGSDEKSFDYLLIDAFSSDSVPVHLITTEAMKLYLSKIKDDGVLVMHVTNRYMDLVPVVAANLAAIDPSLQARVLDFAPAKFDISANHSIAIAISRNPQTLTALDQQGGTAPLVAQPGVDPWTDDFANLPAAMWRRLAIKKY